jgi:outer membrane receptor protein involved in Fe transport
VNVSFVPTDAFGLKSNLLSYLKIKANVAKVGRDATPYLLNSVYTSAGYGNNLASITFPITVGGASLPGFGPSSRIGSSKLTPEFVTSSEVGINFGLFKNRLGVDANYFYTVSSNQIFNVAVSTSSGYNTRTTNIGKMTNKGIELMISATPVVIGNFRWDLSLNYTRIRNNVASIAPGVTSAQITGNAFTGIIPSIAVGHPYGVIIGTANARSPQGDFLVNPATGNYQPGVANSIVANPQPDWLAGLNNTFTYKGVSLSVLVDTRQGGQIYSFAMTDMRSNGMLAITGKDREAPRILPGVIANADGTYSPNNIQVSAQTYWAQLGGLASESAVFDATVYRLRELSLGYTLPKAWLSKTPIGSIFLSVSGRNLFFYAPHYPADPELNTQGAGNIQGLDLNGPPNVRNYGANLKITF